MARKSALFNSIRILWIKIGCLTAFVLTTGAASPQNFPGLNLDPYKVLKTWNYDRTSGYKQNGAELIDTISGQAYLAGLSFSQQWMGKEVSLAFYFTGDSVSRILLRIPHPVKSLDPAFAEKLIKDSLLSESFAKETLKQDSLRRDSVIAFISNAFGPPADSGRTSPAEKSARFESTWINQGYSTVFKDYIEYGDIALTLSKATSWISGEFEIESNTILAQRTVIRNKKYTLTASLMAVPSDTSRVAYKSYLIDLMYNTGQRFVENLPETEVGYIPSMKFDDTDGTGTEDVWISIPMNENKSITREYIFSLQYKEPILIFNSNDFVPSEIRLTDDYTAEINMPDGSLFPLIIPQGHPYRTLFESNGKPKDPGYSLVPKGFTSFKAQPRNRSGSLDFVGRISLNPTDKTDQGGIEVSYKSVTGGWELGGVRCTGSK
jgi:hypothetical protein